MSEERAQYRTAADRGLPEGAQPEPERKRLAPRVHRAVRHDSEKQAELYGRVVSTRFPQDFVDMLKAVEEKYDVGKRELVMLAVCPYVVALERGSLEVPVKADGEIDLPKVPEIT